MYFLFSSISLGFLAFFSEHFVPFLFLEMNFLVWWNFVTCIKGNWQILCFGTFQGNARRLLDKRCDGNTRLGKFSKLGLAPVLWCLIFLLLVTYIHSVILGISICFTWELRLYTYLFYVRVAFILHFFRSIKSAKVNIWLRTSCMDGCFFSNHGSAYVL